MLCICIHNRWRGWLLFFLLFFLLLDCILKLPYWCVSRHLKNEIQYNKCTPVIKLNLIHKIGRRILYLIQLHQPPTTLASLPPPRTVGTFRLSGHSQLGQRLWGGRPSRGVWSRTPPSSSSSASGRHECGHSATVEEYSGAVVLFTSA